MKRNNTVIRLLRFFICKLYNEEYYGEGVVCCTG